MLTQTSFYKIVQIVEDYYDKQIDAYSAIQSFEIADEYRQEKEEVLEELEKLNPDNL